jgi:hypothetical protein
MSKLTKSVVDLAELRAAPYFIWCSKLAGFGVRVFPSGRKVYYADYRSRAGVRRRMSLGAHGKITADEARKLAVVTLGDALKGEDPAEERATRRNSITMADLCDNYLEAAEKGLIAGKRGAPKKASTLYVDRGRIARHIKPLLGKRLVKDVGRADVTKFMRDVATGKTATVEKTERKRGKAIVEGGLGTAARTMGLLGSILSFAVGEGIIESNPAAGVKKPADRSGVSPAWGGAGGCRERRRACPGRRRYLAAGAHRLPFGRGRGVEAQRARRGRRVLPARRHERGRVSPSYRQPSVRRTESGGAREGESPRLASCARRERALRQPGRRLGAHHEEGEA